MKLRLWQIDAFAEKVFEGNPAAIVPLDHWLDDDLMQRIATENNLAETAFITASVVATNTHIRNFCLILEPSLSAV